MGAELPPDSLERFVLDTIKGAFKSREVLEAEAPDHAPPFDDSQAMLQNWATLIGRQGSLVAHLSIVPATRAELMERMPDMLNRAPAWLDAHMRGVEEMNLKLFMRGIAQTMGEHRKAIERVVDEQVIEQNEEIEEALAEAPVPAGTDEEDRSDLMKGVSLAMSAHTKALVDIAYDLETQARSLLKGNLGRFGLAEDDDDEEHEEHEEHEEFEEEEEEEEEEDWIEDEED